MVKQKMEIDGEVVEVDMGDFAVPENPAVCADLLYETRQMRLAMDKQVAMLKARETAMREFLINTLPKSESTGIAGKVARATIVTKEEPTVENWDDFWAWVVKNKAFDCVQRRISAPAIRARWENRKQVKGVGKMLRVSVSLTKVK